MRSDSVGTQFQFCKVKSSRNLLHNKVPTSNTAKSKLVKMVNVFFYHNKKKIVAARSKQIGLFTINFLVEGVNSLNPQRTPLCRNTGSHQHMCNSWGDLWVTKDLGGELKESDTLPTFEFRFPCL